MNDQEYYYLKSKIFKMTNLDINCYKNQQIRRRLDLFVGKYNYPTIIAYCSMLEKNPDKQRELVDFLAINVSEFFRDAPKFKILGSDIFPQLLERNHRLNIWSAACSGGQEPYSLAMMLEEMNPDNHHRIIATDIDESALEQAKDGGPYTTYDVKNVGKNIIDKYFVNDAAGYWVNEKIKKKVVFQRHNLLNDPFEQNHDLIICRNVIIYFSDIARSGLYTKFYDSLKVAGILFLGGSEIMLRPDEYGFATVFPAFYQKLARSIDTNIGIRELSEVVR